MAENGQNRLPGIGGLLQGTARAIVAAEAARVTAGQRSAVAAAALISREQQNAIREAQEAIGLNYAGEAARVARVIQDAKKTTWSAATPRQRLIGASPTMLAELAQTRRLVERSGVLEALTRARPQSYFDEAQRVAEDHRARIAATAIRASQRHGVLQSLAAQTAKARTIATTIERAGSMPTFAEHVALAAARSVNYHEQLAETRAAFRLVPTIRESAERAARFRRTVATVATRLEGSALWFVMSQLNMGELYLFSGLEHAQAEAVVLDALEAIVVEGKFVTAFEVVIQKAPHLTRIQRHHLRQALRHAGRGDFLDAVLPLTCGLEGAFASAARGTGIIDEDRCLVSRPSKKLKGAGSIVKEIDMDSGLRTLLKQVVFADFGNAFRHGDGEDARRQTLFALVGLAGWADIFMGASARVVMVRLMGDRLPEAVSKQRQLTA